MKRCIRPILDVLMLVLLLTLMTHTYLSGAFHEAAGLCLLAAVGVHLRLSFRKLRGILRQPFPWFTLACRAAEVLLVVNLILMAVTGISLARHLFAFTELPIRPSLARPLHRILGHTGLLLAGFHLGLRLPGFLALAGFRQRFPALPWLPRISLYLACGLAAVYGLAAAVRREYFRFDLSSNLMMFSNPEEPVAAFLLDLAAILVLAISTGILARRFLRSIKTPEHNKG